MIANLVIIQTWVRQQIENSKINRPFVTQLADRYKDIEPGSRIYIEVPEEKYTDLYAACILVLRQPVSCESFVSGERSIEEVTNEVNNKPVYWLQATSEGLRQLYPSQSASDNSE